MRSLNDISSTPLPRLAPRKPESNKGDYGHALVIGGSRGMSGAVTLAGRAVLRSGAGLVTLAVPASIQDVVAAGEACYMTRGLVETDGQLSPSAVEAVCELAKTAAAVALGPGLGRSPALEDLVVRLYECAAQAMVVDADALFALAKFPERIAAPAGPRILTPHPGEFARLVGRPPGDARIIASSSDDDRIQLCASLVSEQVIVVLKGHRTIVADSSRACVNQTGNPGMATGGTGDVLTGIITGLLCQGQAPFDAARLGVHLHGRAGDLAAREIGEVSLIASDLIEFLPAAFQSI